MYIKYFLFFLLGMFFTSCFFNRNQGPQKPLDIEKVEGFLEKKIKGKKVVDEYGNINGNVNLDIGEKLQEEIVFKTYQSLDSQLEFMLPAEWEIVDKEGALVFSYIEDKNDFFVFLAQEKDDVSFNLDNYFQFVIEAMSEDSINKLLEVEVYKQNFSGKFAYIVEWESEELGIRYTGFSCYFEDEENFFDFTLKFAKTDDPDILNRILFKVVVLSSSPKLPPPESRDYL